MTTQELTTDYDNLASVVHDQGGDIKMLLQWLYQIERRIDALELKVKELEKINA